MGEGRGMSILKVSCQNLTDVKKEKEVGGWGKKWQEIEKHVVKIGEKTREIQKVNFSLYLYGTFA